MIFPEVIKFTRLIHFQFLDAMSYVIIIQNITGIQVCYPMIKEANSEFIPVGFFIHGKS